VPMQTGRQAALGIPADQAAVDKNAPDVPGYLESFDHAYRNKIVSSIP